MRDYQLEGLMQLGLGKKDIKPWRTKAGIQYRVKVRNETGRLVYITDLRALKKQKLISKYYGIALEKLQKHLSGESVQTATHQVFRNKRSEIHAFMGLNEDEFYDRLENVLLQQEHAYKFDIAIGYTLVNRTNPLDVRHFHAANHNTSLFKNAPVPGPQSVSTRKDAIQSMSQVRNIILEQTLDIPASAYMLKSVDAFQLTLYHRTHRLGSEEAVIPKVIRLNKHVINFKQPAQSNKCLMFCVAYHLEGTKRASHRMAGPTKQVVKKWLTYKGVEFTDKTFPSLYKNFPAMDIYNLSDVEDCFNINIEVFTFDEETQQFDRTIDSTKDYETTMSILSVNNHAMYITNAERFLSKHACSKCCMVFAKAEQLRNHVKNKCQLAYIKEFVAGPTRFRPATNRIARLLAKYGVKDVDEYTDHYMVYDFESVLKPLDVDKAKRLTFTHAHIPVSVSVHDTLTDEAKCFVNDSPKQLLINMFTHAEEKRKLIEAYNRTKYVKLLEKIALLKEKASSAEDSSSYLKSLSQDEDIITWFCNTVPLLGYFSGSYDLNLIKDELFSAMLHVGGYEQVKRRGRPTKEEEKRELSVRAILAGNGYMMLQAGGFRMLDITRYVAAGTSLRQYLKAYLGKCKCPNKIECDCQMSKGYFPYEYLTSFDKLDQPGLPPRSSFDNKHRSSKISDKAWKRVQWVWKHYEMKTLRDLLVWYNDLDVNPFSRAIREQMKFFREFGLDMFADAVSLPGLSEKIMYNSVYNDKEYLKSRPRTPAEAFDFSLSRFNGYKRQDAKKNRAFGMTMEHISKQLKAQRYLCGLCYEPLTKKTASADRINNRRGHENGNIFMTCLDCNIARKDMNIKAFRFKKHLDYNASRLVYSIDNEQKEIYSLMERNIVGGPSVIFHRFARAGMTRIRGGKLVQKVIGLDCNALYLWCLGQDMPCNRLTMVEPYDGLIDDILEDKQFGFVEVDIHTPEHLKDYFSEMCPVFKNVEIEPTAEVIGPFMAEFNKTRANPSKASRKLIGSYFGEKILLYAPLLKWYVEHGMVITKVYSFVKCDAARPFKKFTELVSDARRKGDVDTSKEMIAETMKTVGNTPFGRAGMNQSKHKNVSYVSCDEEVTKLIESNLFQGLQELEGMYEVTLRKRTIMLKNAIHIAIAVYQLAKVRMLQFAYDCVDKYIDRSDYQYLEMDTDSAYIAFSGEHPFPDLIKPELREHFEEHKNEWFPRSDTKDNAKHDKRTPGLLKEEWRGNAMVSLSSKNYICYDPDLIRMCINKKTGKEEAVYYKVKCSAKGVQKSNNAGILTPEKFESVIKEKVTLQATNRGFRVVKQTDYFDDRRMTKGPQMQTYEQVKSGCGYYYDKRIVLEDGITTIPLNI